MAKDQPFWGHFFFTFSGVFFGGGRSIFPKHPEGGLLFGGSYFGGRIFWGGWHKALEYESHSIFSRTSYYRAEGENTNTLVFMIFVFCMQSFHFLQLFLLAFLWFLLGNNSDWDKLHIWTQISPEFEIFLKAIPKIINIISTFFLHLHPKCINWSCNFCIYLCFFCDFFPFCIFFEDPYVASPPPR